MFQSRASLKMALRRGKVPLTQPPRPRRMTPTLPRMRRAWLTSRSILRHSRVKAKSSRRQRLQRVQVFPLVSRRTRTAARCLCSSGAACFSVRLPRLPRSWYFWWSSAINQPQKNATRVRFHPVRNNSRLELCPQSMSLRHLLRCPKLHHRHPKPQPRLQRLVHPLRLRRRSKVRRMTSKSPSRSDPTEPRFTTRAKWLVKLRSFSNSHGAKSDPTKWVSPGIRLVA